MIGCKAVHTTSAHKVDGPSLYLPYRDDYDFSVSWAGEITVNGIIQYMFNVCSVIFFCFFKM